ncbi:hypothetical protein [Flexibacterium corallicola]|uniref:hypothetical protein n=1 Tax=Flexibacterium corallicola TaxID=3037259 RepID=UPI00286F29A7|nr:hypothetical protein [Pseudovibrio sp. M1P-2-3]
MFAIKFGLNSKNVVQNKVLKLATVITLLAGIPYILFVTYLNIVTYQRFGAKFCWYDQDYSSRTNKVIMLESNIFFPNIFKHFDRKYMGLGWFFYDWIIDRPPHFGVIIVKSDEEMKSDEHWDLTRGIGIPRPEVWAWSYKNWGYWNIWESEALITPIKGRSFDFLAQCRKIR